MHISIRLNGYCLSGFSLGAGPPYPIRDDFLLHFR